MTGQFRQSVFGRLSEYEEVNDANRLGCDPAMGWIVGGKAIERQAASTNQMGRFETELLATGANIEVLVDMNGVRFQIHALAHNLTNFTRALALPEELAHLSLTTLREKVVKIGTKVVKNGRYVTF